MRGPLGGEQGRPHPEQQFEVAPTPPKSTTLLWLVLVSEGPRFRCSSLKLFSFLLRVQDRGPEAVTKADGETWPPGPVHTGKHRGGRNSLLMKWLPSLWLKKAF